VYTDENLSPKNSCVCERLKPATVTGSIPVMPFGPLVILTGRSRLFMKMRTISPKTQRHDGEVVATQTQRRCTEQNAEGRRDRHADRRDNQARQM